MQVPEELKEDFDQMLHLTAVSEPDVRYFIYFMVKECDLGIAFHPDTDFEDYIDSNGQMFTSSQAKLLNAALSTCFQACDNLGLDIYSVCLDVLEQNSLL
jgi:hypothetical protein